jgi:hypothetical protein
VSHPSSALNSTYTRWMEQAVGRRFGSEPKATCGDCAMCKPPATGLGRAFLPSVKCCTYWPDVPNFAVGRALLAGGEGASRLREQIGRRIGLSPFGLQSSPRYHRRYESSPGKFGADLEMRCPYYDSGDCTIWENRNAVCQTFFCLMEDGIPGAEVWKQLTLLLALVEEKLSVDCANRHLHHQGFYQAAFQSNGTRNRVTTRTFGGWIEDDGTISAELHAELWGDWAGRELSFFEACAADVEGLSWSEVLMRVGPEAEALSRRLRLMSPIAPPRHLRPARPGLALEYEEGNESVAYTPVQGALDVHVASIDLWSALLAFEGGPLTEEGLKLPDRMLPAEDAIRLWKNGLLVEGGPVVARAVEPEDRLRVVPRLPIQERVLFSETGAATVEISAGSTELSFDEPELLRFGRTLYARRQGFVAAEAKEWSGRSWEQAAELLDGLLALGLLERL